MGWGRGWGFAASVALAACGGTEFTAQGEGTAGSTGAAGSGETVGTSSVSTMDVGSSSVASSGNTTSTNTTVSSGSGGNASSNGGAAGTQASGGAGGQTGTGATTGAGGSAGTGGPRDASASDSSAPEVGPPDASSRDAGIDGPVATQCPPSEPNPNGYCADGLDCTYGSHPRPACRKDYRCSGSHWTVSPATACADPAKCENEMPFPLVNGACAPAEHDCLSASGLYCRCHVVGTDVSPTWDCYPSPTGCPTTPPNKGQLCDLTAKTCDYGTCGIGSKVTTSCSGSIFRWSIVCP